MIKEQQLVLQLNISKQDALAKSEVINSLMAATREAEIRCVDNVTFEENRKVQ